MISRSKEIRYVCFPVIPCCCPTNLYQCFSTNGSWFCLFICRKPEFMMFQVNQDDTEGLKAEIDVSH